LLTNLVLDGLEKSVRQAINSAKTGSSGSCFCRYADDMVIFTTTYRNAEIALEEVKRFLATRGLEIKEAKTRITNFYDQSFIFLNYEFSLILSQNRKRHVACISVPISAIQNFKVKIKKALAGKSYLSDDLKKVNSIVRGWANYYRFAHKSVYVFRSLRYWIWKQVYKKCYKMTKQKFDKANHTFIHDEVMSKYFDQFGNYNTWPMVHDAKGYLITLVDISAVAFEPPTFTNKGKNAYILEDREILDRVNLRMKKRFKDVVLERWFGCCGLCRKRIDINPIPFELHHILPKRFGGKDKPNNFVPLCKAPCHLQVSNAVATKNTEEILKYISYGILILPPEFLSSMSSSKK
jgi:hypothetical protein